MPKRELRFSIVSEGRRRAATWKCWSPSGKTKTDLYIANREMGHALKVSLHESGKCHLAYFHNYWLSEMPKELRKGGSRFVTKWDAPAPIALGVTLVMRIVTPSSAVVAPYEKGSYKKMKWLQNCPEGKATEIDIVITEPGLLVDGWPGKASMKNNLIGSFNLADESIVWFVCMTIDMPNFENLDKRRISPQFFKGGNSRSLVDDGLKVLLIGDMADGSKVLYDCAVKFESKKIAFLEYFKILNKMQAKGGGNILPRGKFFDRFR